jgi:glyoxylase-like metal-dependent hydrolase (beta-lactamase superfamily II)
MKAENRQFVKMLEVPVTMFGRPGVIYPTLIVDGETVVLVDSGYPGQLAPLQEAMRQEGVPFEQLKRVILTHHDIDHLGGLREILSQLPGQVRVLAHADEKAYIQGDKRPLKLAKMEANLEALPEPMKSFYPTFKRAFENASVPVDETLTDGEELPLCGGITVVFTPGHTLGHISLYARESKTLIAGDELCVENGVLSLAPAANNYDTELCRQSLKKLARHDIQTVICYHGGAYEQEANRRIAELAGG